MVEIEIGILRSQCLDPRIDDPRLRGKEGMALQRLWTD